MFGGLGTKEVVAMDRGMRVRSRAHGEQQTKRCPRCGEVLFADMDVCYGCLYNFKKHDEEASFGLVVPDDWDAGLPPYELSDEPAAGYAYMQTFAYAFGLRVRDAMLEVIVPVIPAGITVGRGDGCDVVLRAPAVSRQHVRIEPKGDGAVVTDLGSTNHARLEGAEVSDSSFMEVGDTLDVCGVLLTLMRW